ncbi:hypothetical protein TELCIR_09039 [Teladorsagia circumcincta]|uniref:ceramidase n=1 Tax=Teladorsagia circumcincta TaxID=45464 RepID=A0A2G9UFX6_TELCI|nr:hypothetical protein TELCIR_09039 [Teladorsagia circumcincta]
MSTPMLSPVYYILGGLNPWEGSIITRSLNSTDLLTELDANDTKTGWYLLETNYDQDKPGIFNVLSSRTNLNKLTTYTVLMDVQNGRFETIMQSCPGYCWPF